MAEHTLWPGGRRRPLRLLVSGALVGTLVAPALSSNPTSPVHAAVCPGATVDTDGELQDAITRANDCVGAETIIVEPGTYAPFERTVSDDLTIEARDPSAATFLVDGEFGFQNQNRPFDVVSATLVLRGIRMEQRDAGKIGYVRVADGRVELDGVELIGTFGDENGGGWGIDATDSDVVVTDTELASMDGTALDVDGGSLMISGAYVHDGHATGVFVRDAPVEITGSRFVANGRGNSFANGIDVSNPGGTGPRTVTIHSTVVSGHPADGIVIRTAAAPELVDVELRGSSRSDTGLAISGSPGFSVTDSSFDSLQTGVSTGSDGSFSGVTITGNSVAGVQSSNTNELQFTNSSITGNAVDCAFDRGSFAVDNGGNSDSDGTCGFTANTPPTVEPNASPQVAIAPIVVDVSAGADDADGTITGYLWNGATTPVAASSQRFAYAEAGTYEVSVQAIDDDGAVSDLATATIVVLPEPAPRSSLVELTVGWPTADEQPDADVRFSNTDGVHTIDLPRRSCVSDETVCSGHGVVPPSDGEPYAVAVTGLPAGWTWLLDGDCAPGPHAVPDGWFDVAPSSSTTCTIEISQPSPPPPAAGAAEVTLDVTFDGDWAADAVSDPTLLLQGTTVSSGSCSPPACSLGAWWDDTSVTVAPDVELVGVPGNWLATFSDACSGLTTTTAVLAGVTPGATPRCTIELVRVGADPVTPNAGLVDVDVVWRPLATGVDTGAPGTGLRLTDGVTTLTLGWDELSPGCGDPGGPCAGRAAVPASVAPGYLPSVADLPITWSTLLDGDCASTADGGAAVDGSSGWFSVEPGSRLGCRIVLIEHPSPVPTNGALLGLTVRWESDQPDAGADAGAWSLEVGTAPASTDLDALLVDRSSGSSCAGNEAIVNGCEATGVPLPDLDGTLTIDGPDGWTATFTGDCADGPGGPAVRLAPATRATCTITFVKIGAGTPGAAGVVALTVTSPSVPAAFSSIELAADGGATTSVGRDDLWSGVALPCDTASPTGCLGSVAAPPGTYAVDVRGLPPGWTFRLSGDCAFEASSSRSPSGWFEVAAGARSTCDVALVDTGAAVQPGRPTTDLELVWTGIGEFESTAPDAIPTITFSDGSGSVTELLRESGAGGPCAEPGALPTGCSGLIVHDVGDRVDLDANAAWLPVVDGRCAAVGEDGDATVVELLTGVGERATCTIRLRQIAESEPIPAPTALLEATPVAGDVPLDVTLDASSSGPVNTIESYRFSFTGESFDAAGDPVAPPTPFELTQGEPVLATTLPNVAPATRWFVTVTTTDLFGRSTTSATTTIEAGPVPPPRPPEAVDDAFKVDLATTLDVAAPGVLGNDDGGDAPVLVTSATPPAHAAAFTLSADGSFSYTPTPEFVGTDTFEYRVFSDLGSDVGLVSIDVAGLAGDVTIEVEFLGGPVEDVGFDAAVSFPNAVSALASEPLAVEAGWPFADPDSCSGVLSDWFEFDRPGCSGAFDVTIGTGELLRLDADGSSDFALPLFAGDCAPIADGAVIDLDATGSPTCRVSMVRTVQGDATGAALHLTQRWVGEPDTASSPDVTVTTAGVVTLGPAPLDVDPILDAPCPPPAAGQTPGQALAACVAAVDDCPSHDAGCQAFVALPVGDGADVTIEVEPTPGWQTHLLGDCGPTGELGTIAPGTLVICEVVHVASEQRGGVLFEWSIDPDEAFFGPLGPRPDIRVDARLVDGATTVAEAAYADALPPQDQPALDCSEPDTTVDDLPATCRRFVPVDAGSYALALDNDFDDLWDATPAGDCGPGTIDVAAAELTICTIALAPTRPAFAAGGTTRVLAEGTGADTPLNIGLGFDEPTPAGYQLAVEILTGDAYGQAARARALPDPASPADVAGASSVVTLPTGTLRHTVSLGLVADGLEEADEGFVVAIEEVDSGRRLLVHVVVEDDDTAPVIQDVLADFEAGPSPLRNRFAADAVDGDGDIVEYRWALQPSGRSWTTGTPDLDVVMTDVGVNTLRVVAVDAGGNESTPMTVDVVVEPTTLTVTPAVAVEGDSAGPLNRPWSVAGDLARALEVELRVGPTGPTTLLSRPAVMASSCAFGRDAAGDDTDVTVGTGPSALPIVVCRDDDVERDATLLVELVVPGDVPGDETVVLSRTLTIRDDDRYDLEPITIREADVDLSFAGGEVTRRLDDGRPPWYSSPPAQVLLAGTGGVGATCSPLLGGTGQDVGLRLVGSPSVSAVVEPQGAEVDVVVCADNLFEAPAVYDLVLVAPDGSVDSTTVTVLDNDQPPTITTTGVTVEESSTNATRKVSIGVVPVSYVRSVLVLTPPSGDATPGVCLPGSPADFEPLPGEIVQIPADASGFDVDVTICGDTPLDDDGSFSLLLARPPATPEQLLAPEVYATVQVEIVDVDAPEVSVADVTVVEGTGGSTTAVVTVSASGLGVPVGVEYRTLPGGDAPGGAALPAKDYEHTEGSLAPQPAPWSRTIEIPIVGDLLEEGDQAFRVEITTSGAGVTKGSAQVTILDDDDIVVNVAGASVVEGDSVDLDIELSNPSEFPVEVAWATADGSGSRAATEGADYAEDSSTAVFPPGASTRTIRIDTVADGITEGDETFLVDFETSRGEMSNSSITVTILDDGPPRISPVADLVVVVPDGTTGLTKVGWTANAIDDEDGAVAVVCDPASGAGFPLGTARVECTAEDSVGNTDVERFDVTVVEERNAAAALVGDDRITGPGDDIRVRAGGYRPFEPVRIELRSDPIVLGTSSADAQGVVDVTVTIPADAPIGDHDVAIVPVDESSPSSVTLLPISVARVPVGTLPATGGGIGWSLALAASMVASGLLVFAAALRGGRWIWRGRGELAATSPRRPTTSGGG